MMTLIRALIRRCWRLIITPYLPEDRYEEHLLRLVTQENNRARVAVGVLTGREGRRLFGVDLARHGIQPVFVRIENRSAESLRLQLVSIDPRYYTPLEAAGAAHFSILRRLSAFGLIGWLFLPVLLLLPFKLITAHRANRRMDRFFRSRSMRLAPTAPGDTAEGFVFTTLDLGSKVVRIRLSPVQDIRQLTGHNLLPPSWTTPSTDTSISFDFTIPVPGLEADYLDRGLPALRPTSAIESCDAMQLIARLEGLPATTTNSRGTRQGDPVNLVVIGDFAALMAAFAARWDECESISLATCWKTMRAFLLGTNYRYSPVSPLHLYGRDQDVALQRTRHSINERLHLRLWLTDLAFQGRPVWVGQVSRDIGVRFTTRAWNLTTHRIDPDVDESRDYVVEDLSQAGHVLAVGFVGGVGRCGSDSPRRNLTGDPYFTDGQRAVVVVPPSSAG